MHIRGIIFAISAVRN